MSLPQTTIQSWITARLTSDAALMALIGSDALRIVDEVAGKSILFPYVLISPLVPGIPGYVSGARAIVNDGVYLVRGVHKAKSYGPPLQSIAERIIALLHGERGVYDGAAGISSYLDDHFSLTEARDSEQYRHLGGRFRITINA